MKRRRNTSNVLVEQRYPLSVVQDASPLLDPFWHKHMRHDSQLTGHIRLGYLGDYESNTLPAMSIFPTPIFTYTPWLCEVVFAKFMDKWFDEQVTRLILKNTKHKRCKWHHQGTWNVFQLNVSKLKVMQVLKLTQAWIDNQNRHQLFDTHDGHFFKCHNFISILFATSSKSDSLFFCHWNFDDLDVFADGWLPQDYIMQHGDIILRVHIDRKNFDGNKRRACDIDFYTVNGLLNDVIGKSKLGTVVSWFNSIVPECVKYVKQYQSKSQYPLEVYDRSDGVDIQLHKLKCPITDNVWRIEYYIHITNMPSLFIMYLLLGSKLYTDLTYYNKVQYMWYHLYHKCDRCKKCHRCDKCQCCFIQNPNNHREKECLNCITKLISCFDDDELEDWTTEKQKLWQVLNFIFINNQKYLCIGVETIHNAYDNDKLSTVESIATQLDNTQYNDATTDRTNGKRKHFFNCKYVWRPESPIKDVTLKHAGGLRTNVASIPNNLIELLFEPLEQLGIIPRNSKNALALNVYEDPYEGLGSHFDEKHHFDMNHDIDALRLYGDAAVRFGTTRFGKNAMFWIPLNRGVVWRLVSKQFAGDWIKHCITGKDSIGLHGCFIMRRVYPWMMQMCHQCNNKF